MSHKIYVKGEARIRCIKLRVEHNPHAEEMAHALANAAFDDIDDLPTSKAECLSMLRNHYWAYGETYMDPEYGQDTYDEALRRVFDWWPRLRPNS